MYKPYPAKQPVVRALFNFVFWTLVFGVAYSQSPLYTSNQNQYFLHGLAGAGFGFLHQDWLANTLDPTPVFSLLVSLTYRFLHSEALFYGYYALLMGIYLFSLLGITSLLFPVRRSTASWLLFLAMILLVHSAGLRFALSRLLGANWSYILEDGVADQRMLGPVFQPSTFGVLLMLSSFLFLLRRPYLAVLSAALAATVHPTYLLSAGLLTCAYMAVTWVEECRLKKPVSIGLLALLAISPILFYVYSSFGSAPPETSRRAQEILVAFRIPHHAVVSQWFDLTAVLKILLVVASIYVVRRTRLFLILLVPSLAAVTLTAIQVLSDSDSLALIFPWRISVYLVPLSVAILLAFLVSNLFEAPRLREAGSQRLLVALSSAAIALAFLVGGVRFTLDLQRKATSPERAVEAFVMEHKLPGDTYLTPVKLQDFRLATGAPVFVEFKSIPYRDTDVLEWRRRIQLADQFYKNPSCDLIQQLNSEEGVTHVILPDDSQEMSCSSLKPVYRDNHYGVYTFAVPTRSYEN